MDSYEAVKRIAERLLKDGVEKESYQAFMKDAEGVLDSINRARQDTLGGAEWRTTGSLRQHYADLREEGDARQTLTDSAEYAEALEAVDEILEMDRWEDQQGRIRWGVGDVHSDDLEAVEDVATDEDIQQLYE